MKGFLLICLQLFLIILCGASDEEPSEIDILKSNNRFALNLYQILAITPGNVFFSPLSLHVLLSMVYQGAQDTSAVALSTTLNFPQSEMIAESYSRVLSLLNRNENINLFMGNKIYVTHELKLNETFKRTLTTKYASDLELIDFSQSAVASKTINDWVLQATQNKIKDLMGEDDVDDLTKILLVNAIYFSGDWEFNFRPEFTKKIPFYLDDQHQIEIDMMSQKSRLKYKKDSDLDAEIITMPYRNPNFGMLVVLPTQNNGLKDLEKKMSKIRLESLIEGLDLTTVDVFFPKFQMESDLNLENSLTELGLQVIFDDRNANFSGIFDLSDNVNRISITKVVQKAFIEINEKGSRATVATGAVGSFSRSLQVPLPPKVFRADHPFIFIIYEKSIIFNPIFMGRFSNPK